MFYDNTWSRFNFRDDLNANHFVGTNYRKQNSIKLEVYTTASFYTYNHINKINRHLRFKGFPNGDFNLIFCR